MLDIRYIYSQFLHVCNLAALPFDTQNTNLFELNNVTGLTDLPQGHRIGFKTALDSFSVWERPSFVMLQVRLCMVSTTLSRKERLLSDTWPLENHKKEGYNSQHLAKG